MKNCKCILLVGLVGLVAGSAQADEKDDRERVLKQFFEGRSVTARIDLPAAEMGVDIRVGHAEPLDVGSLEERLAQTGVSIREGARVPITKVHLKGDLIEFQLAGGGFDWVWDTQSRVSPVTGESRWERDLEKRLREEHDPDRRRELEHELKDARRDREREERYRREAADAENARREQQDHQRALFKGSRFNLRWDEKVPAPAETPQAIMELLSPWVDFSGLPGAPQPPGPPRLAGDERRSVEEDVRTGMSWAEVQDRLGAPDHVESRRDDDMRRALAIYSGRGLELTFVNDILVRIRPLEPGPRD
jgi:hypothetical protein